MGATVPRHALIFRVHRLALAGMTGAWLVAGVLGAGPARAGEPGGALAGPAPSPKPPQANASLPVSATRKTPHQAYLFFLGSKRPSQRPAGAEGMQAAAGPPVDAQHPAYLFFTPGKKTAQKTPAPVDARRPSYLFFTPEKKKAAQTSAPAAGQVPPGPPPAPGSGLGPGSQPPALAPGIAAAGDGLPLTPPQPRLLFFSPKRDEKKNTVQPHVTNQTARPEGRKPTMLAAIERVPVRLPDAPTRNRNPPPYLIFQPKPVRDRPSPAKTSGTSSSAITPPRQGVTAVARAPWPAARLDFPGFDLVPTLTLADLPRLQFAPVTAPARTPQRTTTGGPLQAPAVGSGSGGGNDPAPRLR